MPVIRYSVGNLNNFDELNDELTYKKKRDVNREELIPFKIANNLDIARNVVDDLSDENDGNNDDGSNINSDFRTKRASSVTYSSSGCYNVRQFQKQFQQNRNFTNDRLYPPSNSDDVIEFTKSLIVTNGVTGALFCNRDNVMDGTNSVNVRRHSSASCCVTETTPIYDSSSTEVYSKKPPPIPARLNKPPPTIPERRSPNLSVPTVQNGPTSETKFDASSKITRVTATPKDNVIIVNNNNNNNNSGHIKINPISRFDNSAIPIKIPPPPQSSHSKRSSIVKTTTIPTRRNSVVLYDSTRNNDKNVRTCIDTQRNRSRDLIIKDQEEGYFKFPEPVIRSTENVTLSTVVANYNDGNDNHNNDSNNEYLEENDPTKCGLTLVRKKSGKKVPPPIQTYVDHQLGDQYPNLHLTHHQNHFESSAVCKPCTPIRHDSNLSCSDGGISQTSSPGYMVVRSLESPLLPKVKNHSTNRYVKKKFTSTDHHYHHYNHDRTALFCSETNKFQSSAAVVKDESKSNLVASDLTKSQSTPCGLQTTVVEYRQRKSSDSVYQNKVIQVTRKASISNSQLRFQFIQIMINVLVLIAVAAGLACYFRAYPMTITTVKYINHTTTYIHNITHGPADYMYYHPDFQFNSPAGYICSPFVARFCKVYKIPYNVSIFPNFIGSLTDREAEVDLEVFEAIANVRCYQLAPLFLCSLYQPKCGINGLPVQPCKRLCEDMNDRCGIFLEVFGLQLPRKINCSEYPISDDPDKCVGTKEIRQLEIQELTVVCADGFKCDKHRCIPADWRCDGHIDCEDETDELNCNQCPGQLHCGMGQCIATSHICDGILNCPWGQDERNCLRASVTMGNVGYGDVEIFVPSEKSFRRACVTSWDAKHSPQLICDLLGYEYLNYTELYSHNNKYKVDQVRFNPANNLNNKIKLFHDMKECDLAKNHPMIRASCNSYVCGIRKQSFGMPSTRIVGGVQSNPGDWPFLAAILGGPKEVFYCAGVLISDQWVLSAAHCVGNFNLSHSPKDWTIQLGMTRRFSHSYFGQKIKVRKVIPHPSYNLGVPHDNDIALFQLRDRVRFHDHLLPVCMPTVHVKLIPPRNCTVIGWGKREDSDNLDYEPTVHEVQVPILHRNLCNKWLKKRNLNVTPNMICAGYEEGGKDACQGDSGGPLLCQDNDNPSKWFVAGIVSWGIKCAHPHLPGIYANVPAFVSWIDHQVKFYSY